VSVAQAEPPVVVIAPPVIKEGPNRSTAVLLSVGTTLVGLVLLTQADNDATAFFGGAVMTLGPSTGRWYAGELSLLGVGLRSVAAGAMFLGESDALAIAGGALWVGSAMVDIVLADRAARDYHTRNLTVKPMVQTQAGGATGLVLAGHF
jgi:hypothetical protein